MKRVSIFLTALLLQGFCSFAQSSAQQFEVTDNEINNGYIIKKVWLERYEKPKVEIAGSEFKTVSGIADSLTSGSVNSFDIVMGMERKRPFAFVRIPAYIRDGGDTRQLTSFSLTISESKDPAPAVPALKTTTAASVLSSGNWYKISVKERGVYKLDFNFIQSKLGVDPATINPANIRIYGNGGVMLSESNAVPVPDDLTENAIVVVDGNDGAFNQGDYVLFYANGPMGWTPDPARKLFLHRKNIYEDKSYYFINFDLGSGQRVPLQQENLTSNTTVTSFNDFAVHNEDLINIGRFGKLWWGEEFSNDPGKQSARSYSFSTPSTGDSAVIRMRFGSRSFSDNNTTTLKINNQVVGAMTLDRVFSGSEASPITHDTAVFKIPGLNNGNTDILVTYTPNATDGKGYLDYLELNWRRPLSFNGGQMSFRDWNSVGSGNIALFQIQNAPSNTTVWDITNPLQPVKMNLSGNAFTNSAATLREYIAFDGTQFHSPEFVKKIDNQNLHSTPQVDYIIVTHKDFLDAANRLADFHRQTNNLRTVVATTEQVYNEFSSGSQDIAAIRDFARMFYKRAGMDTTEMPRYLLLFGDASYDYKDRTINNTNYVPTYETSESANVIYSYCSDDYFSFLDDNEDIENWDIANTMDVGVGRLPVTKPDAANNIVDKIINYTKPGSLGAWRISTTIVSDNGDGDMHFLDAELMAGMINYHTNLYNENKVHLSAIPTVSTPGGTRAPDANKAINDAVFKGTFLINYNGHGSITTMAHERILTQDDFNLWKNKDKLPIMVTATCDFSKYDDPAYVSAGEKLILKPDGGAIALLTTTQLVYAHLNQDMNKQYLDATFRQYSGEWPAFGDGFRYSKNKTYVTAKGMETLANYRKFVLLGDPALTPAYPKHRVVTESILDGNTLQPADTLKALGKYQITGSVKNSSGTILSDFNGRLYVTIFDKPRVVNTISTPQRSFKIQNNIIYKGKVTVQNGHFSFSFIAPKDLNYDLGKGKISYYAENGVTDAAGADTMMYVGGFSDDPVEDNNPPVVKPFMNDSLFIDGGITGSNTLLYAQLSDETGINVSGNGIGHDLTAVLDDNVEVPYILNDYYETAPNNFQKGYVHFPLTGLADGRHTIRVKAWDMNNNSGEGTVNFEVINGNIMQVKNLMNYPNPFSNQTHFVFEHNHPEEELKVEINIYSTSGTLVRNIRETYTPGGSRSNEITWEGTDNNGVKLPSGLYVYRIILTTPKGIQATAHQKLVIVR